MKNPKMFLCLTKDVSRDLGYPVRFNYILQLKVTEGYAFDELPENQNIVLPEGGGTLILSCKK